MKQGLTNWTCNRHRRKIVMRVNQRVIVIPERDQVMKAGNLLQNALKGNIAIKKVELVSQGVKDFISHACKCACECAGVG